jgi:hypothetical protein
MNAFAVRVLFGLAVWAALLGLAAVAGLFS